MHKDHIFEKDHRKKAEDGTDGVLCTDVKTCNCDTKLKNKMWVTRVRLGDGEEHSRDKIDRTLDDGDEKEDYDHSLFVFLQEETVVVVVIDDGKDNI
jgi:hypothetical protein